MPLFLSRPILITAVQVLAVLSFISNASADTERVASGFNYVDENLSTKINLASFDTGLGELQSIDVTLQLNICPDLIVTNNTEAPIGFTDATVSLPVTAQMPGSLVYNTNLTSTDPSGIAQPGTSTIVLPGSGKTLIVNESIDPSQFASWEDQFKQTLSFRILSGSPTGSGTATGDVVFGASAADWAKVSVTYTYLATAAAPEPSGRLLSLIVGAVMLVGIGSQLRQRALVA